MTGTNRLAKAPPYAVEQAVRHLGGNLRTARLRRNLTVAQVAEKIGTGPRAVMDAEKGKASAGIAVYVALLWVYGMHQEIAEVGNPTRDAEGLALELSNGRKRARAKGDLANDF